MIAHERDSRLALLVLVGALACAALLLWWMCARDPAVRFFLRDARADWLVYPSPPDPVAHRAVELETVFMKSFALERVPSRASLSVRLHRRGEVSVNGAPLPFASDAAKNWKEPLEKEVSALLRAGSNQIVVRAWSSFGPPAVWLALEGDGLALRSDSSWKSSLAGATVKPARLATTPMSEWSTPAEEADVATKREAQRNPRTLSSLARSWLALLAFAALSVGLVFGVGSWLVRDASEARESHQSGRRSGRGPRDQSDRPARLVFVAAALAWALLFWNNRALDPSLGFDSEPHVAYVQYILDHGALPLAHQGWEMYQPPLYYLIAALVVKLGGQSRVDASAIAALRWLGYLAGVLQALFVLASLRLLFPERPGRALAGLVLAACLPMQLYLYQYVTNESWAAVLVSSSTYLALRILKRDDTTLRSHLWLGVALGAAMLTKFSALLPLLIILVVLAARLHRRGMRDARTWGRTLGVTTAACLVVCGWHFARVALRFGNPFIGNWDPATGFAWWQDPGYRVLGYYLRFGASLYAPIFSSFHSFADAIYSTLWGDGMVGGRTWVAAWPPWNYELMSAGYLLALLPCAALVIGAAAATWRLVREPRAEWFLLLGLLGSTAFGIVVMTLKVPSYAQAKAFYGSSALVPLCALGAWGLDLLATRARALRAIVFVLFGVWALNSYTSYWSKNGAPAAAAPALATEDDPDALTNRALAEQKSGRREQALETFRRVVSLAPDHPRAHILLAMLHSQGGEHDAAIEAAREALRVRPAGPSIHALLGDFYRAKGDREGALAHYEISLRIQPGESRALAGRAKVLAEMGR